MEGDGHSVNYTLIDYFIGFHFLKRKKRYSAGAQAAYFALLAEFELNNFPRTLRLSTRELKDLAGLKSVSAVQEVRNVLKNNRLIDFETINRTTVYKLLSDHLPKKRVVEDTEHLPNGNCTYPAPFALFATPYSLTRSDNFFKEEDDDERARKEDNNLRESDHAQAPATATTIAAISPNDLWLYEAGYRLHGSLALRLDTLARAYGRVTFHAALIKAMSSKNSEFLKFDYFEAVLTDKKNFKKLKKEEKKEGEKRDQLRKPTDDRSNYDITGTDSIPDWAKD